MSYLNRIVICEDKCYSIKDVDIKGHILVRDLSKPKGRLESLDPIRSKVYLTDLWENVVYKIQPEVPERLLKYLGAENNESLVFYKNKDNDILLLFSKKEEESLFSLVLLSGSSMYTATVVNGNIQKPDGIVHSVELKNYFSSISWVGVVTMFLERSEDNVHHYREFLCQLATPVEIESPIHVGIPECKKGILNFISRKDNTYFLLDSEYLVKEIVKGYSEIKRKDLIEVMSEFIDSPCLSLAEGEIDNVVNILNNFGFSKVSDRVRKGINQKTNFKYNNSSSIGIVETGKSSYEIVIFEVREVLSTKGIPLMYSLVSHPIGNRNRFTILATGSKKELFQELIKYPYADLLRGRYFTFRGLDNFCIYDIRDTKDYIQFLYFCNHDYKQLKIDRFDKEKSCWSDIESANKEERDFLSKSLNYFNRKYGILG